MEGENRDLNIRETNARPKDTVNREHLQLINDERDLLYRVWGINTKIMALRAECGHL